MNNKEKWIAVVGLLDGKPYEIFTGSAEDTFMILKLFPRPGSSKYGIMKEVADMTFNMPTNTASK